MGTTETKKMRVGVVGCGAISDIYLTNMIHNFENLEVAACCAGHLEHAKKKAEQYGIKGCTYEEILADPSIEMVVILTPAPTHEGLIRQALEAGKHVYTEKTMTLAPETAAKLIGLAEEKHLYLGSAPDTFLGSALQTARKAIDDGLIGEVTSFEYICPLGAMLAAIMFFWVAGKKFAVDAVNAGADKPIGKWFVPLGKYVLVPLSLVALIAGALLGGIG